MSSISLKIGSGWTEVAARKDGPELLVEHGGRLQLRRSDGVLLNDFGPVGPVDCPLAYDPVTRTAYRYVSSARYASSTDYSQLRAFALDKGTSRTICDLPLNQWVLWLLEWIGRGEHGGQLFGLLASDLALEDRINIQHRLFAFTPTDGATERPRIGQLCRDAYRPLAFSHRRKELIFSGAEGTYLVGLKGERLASLSPEQVPPAASASFDPSGGPLVALGAGGLHRWNTTNGSCEQLTRVGRHPVWTPDGSELWYAGSSGSLMSFDLATGANEELLAIANDRIPDFWRSRPAQLSADKDYLAVMLSAKRLRGVTRQAPGIEKVERIYQDQDCFCVLHRPSRQFWRIDGNFFSAFRWV